MLSVWSSSVSLPKFDTLSKNINTDVLIIGGGIAGILCAYMLNESGIDCVLVEANRICGGVTENTTAKITSQHGLCYDKLIKRFGVEKAKLYLAANEQAIRTYRSLCSKISCDFEEKSSFVYSLSDQKKIEQEADALKEIGYKAYIENDLPLPFNIAKAIRFDGQAQFNPLLFLSEISRDLRIYENTKVLELIKNTARCNGGKISANKIIVATHFPFINKHGSYFIKMYQSRSYVIALENAPRLDGMYIDGSGNGLSFRSYKDLLLLGGSSHRTGKPSSAWQTLRDFARKYYPDAKEKYHWATQDCMTLDGVPYIGRYSAMTENLYVATGFNKWGMTSSMVAAEVLRDMICGNKNSYISLFSPSRTVLRPQLAVNSAEALSGVVNFSKKRCPHLGCTLKWNKQERTWDCPCHGSRFTEDGHLLDNPATDDLKK